MSKHHSFIDTIDQIVTDGINKGILHLNTIDTKLKGNIIETKSHKSVNFGSCSYLGLEFDERLINGAVDAARNYGTQFSASRAYMSSTHYNELENLFGSIFDAPSIVAPTTTLGHIAAIPVLVQDKDAIILDHQVHNSVQTAVNLLKPRGVHVELLRHNRMDLLEERVKILSQKYHRIWYMADGVYSMYGDASPVLEVEQLLNKYPQLNYYVDDAHGMSCYGKHGRGYVLNKMNMHPQMVFATSLAKAFATGGAVLVFPNKELARKVRTCGGPLITSGPMQPAALGAAIASAKIHLSDEIYSLQQDLHENIKFAKLMLKKYALPVVSEDESPVFFIGVSLPKIGYNLVRRMLDEGYYLNLGIFPAVPMKNTGIRFTITRLHTFEQIEGMIKAMAYHFPLALEEEGFTMKEIYNAFKLETPEQKEMDVAVKNLITHLSLKVEHTNTINDINIIEWNDLLGNRGTFDWEGLRFLENSFKNNDQPQDNWKFDYIIIRDTENKIILATFLTTAIWKDDMLSPSAVSAQVEEIRKKDDPYYLTSKVLSIGSLLTEGNHLYLDRTSALWKNAMILLLEKISELQEKNNASSVMMRDFDSEDIEMDGFLVDNGYFKISMPENHTIENLSWKTKEEFLQQQSSLYLNVKEHSLALNTFTLPFKVFKNILQFKNWDVLTLKLKPEYDKRENRQAVAAVFGYISEKCYNPVIVGLDYKFQNDFMCYRQAIYRVILRAKELNMQKINLGFGATVEKKKYGAIIYNPVAYVQAKDNYNMEVLGTMSALTPEHA